MIRQLIETRYPTQTVPARLIGKLCSSVPAAVYLHLSPFSTLLSVLHPYKWLWVLQQGTRDETLPNTFDGGSELDNVHNNVKLGGLAFDDIATAQETSARVVQLEEDGKVRLVLSLYLSPVLYNLFLSNILCDLLPFCSISSFYNLFYTLFTPLISSPL